MIICSNCQHANVSGTLFCVECGAQLDGVETITTATGAAMKVRLSISGSPDGRAAASADRPLRRRNFPPQQQWASHSSLLRQSHPFFSLS